MPRAFLRPVSFGHRRRCLLGAEQAEVAPPLPAQFRRWQALPRLGAWSGRSPHCTAVARTVTVHYRWHPLHGRTLRVLRFQPGKSGVQIFYEHEDGPRGAIPEWMTDSAACSMMALGCPVVAIEALLQLVELLEATPRAQWNTPEPSKEVPRAQSKEPATRANEPLGSNSTRGSGATGPGRGTTGKTRQIPCRATAGGSRTAKGGKRGVR